MSTTYSAFFSSGLLAPPNLYPKSVHTPPSSPGLLPSSPGLLPPSPGTTTRGSSPMPMLDDSDVEDGDTNMDEDFRSRTPTPSNCGTRSRSGSVTSQQQQQSQNQNQRPRLRKRRSSLTVSTSPMNVIKSPQRNAGNALHLQQRLPPFPTGSIGRSRSGSLNFLGFGNQNTAEVGRTTPAQNMNIASQGTSLIGRMRSGSVGGSTLGNLFRPRRIARRLASGPAPAPPPTAPLPALPTDAVKHNKSNSLFHNTSIFSNPKAIFSQVANVRQQSNDTQQVHVKKSKGRDRAFSCTQGVTVGARIDEEMKEN